MKVPMMMSEMQCSSSHFYDVTAWVKFNWLQLSGAFQSQHNKLGVVRQCLKLFEFQLE